MADSNDMLAATSSSATAPQLDAARPGRRLRLSSRAAWYAVILIAVVQYAVTLSATRHNSATFDEITVLTAGARGFATGRWDMLPDGPPVTHYLYGLPVYLSGLNYPDESELDATIYRYEYARQLIWKSGNDGERIMLLARAVAAACAALLVLLVFAYAKHHFDTATALLAAVLVAFLPDVLAHGGVAYNDIVLAPAFLAALWALDRAARAPTIARGVLAGAIAGVLVSVAIGVKHTALVLGPIGLALIVVELSTAADRRAKLGRLLVIAGVATVAGYLAQVALYRGDFTLALLRSSTLQAHDSINVGRGLRTYLLGTFTEHAGWSFYPIAFFFKTPAALHLLMVLALLGAFVAARKTALRAVGSAPWRALLIALLIYGAALINAELTIGFRYALSLLPLIALLTAAGVTALWRRTGFVVRTIVVGLTVWAAVRTLSFYPYFLAYTSEYQPSRDRGYEVFVDSSLDWGQGLIALRDFMRDEGIDQILLSYFGSALPEGYGIDYVPLPSFFPLPYRPMPAANRPKFVAVSATNLVGLYFQEDHYAALRRQEPYRVLAHTIFIYPVAR